MDSEEPNSVEEDEELLDEDDDEEEGERPGVYAQQQPVVIR